MSEVRINFLNWRPDAEDIGNDGLITADNVIHDTEGYKQIGLVTNGAVSTLTSSDTLYWLTGSTVLALQCRQTGTLKDTSGNNKVIAYFRDGVTPEFIVDHLKHTAASSFNLGGTGGAIVSSQVLSAFQVTELNNTLFVCAEGAGNASSGTAVSVNFTGYVDIGL